MHESKFLNLEKFCLLNILTYRISLFKTVKVTITLECEK